MTHEESIDAAYDECFGDVFKFQHANFERGVAAYLNALGTKKIRNNPENYVTVGMAQDKIRADLKATGKLLYDLCDAYAACNGEDHPAYCEARRALAAIAKAGDEQ